MSLPEMTRDNQPPEAEAFFLLQRLRLRTLQRLGLLIPNLDPIQGSTVPKYCVHVASILGIAILVLGIYSVFGYWDPLGKDQMTLERVHMVHIPYWACTRTWHMGSTFWFIRSFRKSSCSYVVYTWAFTGGLLLRIHILQSTVLP